MLDKAKLQAKIMSLKAQLAAEEAYESLEAKFQDIKNDLQSSDDMDDKAKEMVGAMKEKLSDIEETAKNNAKEALTKLESMIAEFEQKL